MTGDPQILGQVKESHRQAQAIGFTNDFHAIAIAALATIPLIALLRTAGPPNRRRRARA